jgi:hypothetical protein
MHPKQWTHKAFRAIGERVGLSHGPARSTRTTEHHPIDDPIDLIYSVVVVGFRFDRHAFWFAALTAGLLFVSQLTLQAAFVCAFIKQCQRGHRNANGTGHHILHQFKVISIGIKVA